MKKIILLISMCFTIACTTQKQVVINGKNSYTIPKDSQPITPEQVLAKFPDLEDKSNLNSDVKLFIVSNMLVGLGARSAAPDKEYAKSFDYYRNQLKSVMEGNMGEGVLAVDTVNDISLKTCNNHDFMVVDYKTNKEHFLSFRSFQKGSYSAYYGFIRFSKNTSKEQANAVLDGILNNIKILK